MSNSPGKTSCWKFPYRSLRRGSSARSEPSTADAIEQKEKELQLRGQKVDTLNSQLNIFKQQLEKRNKEISSLKDENEVLARKNWCMNEDKALNLKSLEQQLEKRNKEISSLKDKNEAKWKKREKAIVSFMVGNVELCSKTSDELLVLYYTNRADIRMSSNKFRKALDDCKMVTYLDPGCLKAHLLAGSCHLVLGEIDEALCCYNKCLDSNMALYDESLNHKAFDGFQDAKKVANNIKESAELLQLKTFESVIRAMEIIAEALSVSCYSEKLLKLKGEALFQLHKYEEVVQMCEQTLGIAEKNCDKINDSKCQSDEDPNRQLHIWRWSLMSRSYYCMGKLDMALIKCEKYEQLALSETKTEEPSLFSAATIRELLQIKKDGNDAFKSKKYMEAAKHYTNAIMRSIESRPFASICLSNRAAAHQSLGNVIDAIKDCNLAIALDGDNKEAISRRARLHEKIRDYKHASLDLKRYISLLEKRSEEKDVDDIKISRRHLPSLEKSMKKGISMDLYMILGLKRSESDGIEIKKAYDKAVRSPDEEAKCLAMSESGADGHIWKEIKKTIHTDADKLFKIIKEAYDEVSNSNKVSSFLHEFQLLFGYIVPLVPYPMI